MISKRARFINFILRLLKVQQRLADYDTGMKFLARDRKNGPARPGRWFKKHTQINEHSIDGHKIYEIEPNQGASRHHIFYLHGGGYAFQIVLVHWATIKKLIKAAGASVTVPLYPLAPEHDWSQSYPVVMQAYEKAAAKYGAQNITVMGDSAGGGFSLGLTQMLRDQGKPLPGKVILLSPWLDATASDPSQQELEQHDVLLSVQGARTAGQFWAGEGNDPSAFPVSPLFASIDNLPPIALFCGSHDLLYADALRLKDKAKKHRADIALYVGEKMQHVWMLLPIREAKLAREQIIAFITR
ncbi:alpha/beta hydrolase [Parasphingorhabdus cellanae]|uniref:Alpha/beta hydrolase n=1 Tax=Parasphingorhabdus cellanae TaxID=2806553 RepID=A0ABX7T735_9SPHN|nr:alpha/beta hydrolase [Parasphingorhabdus cellanae]QTD56718.1 alpha/beta hydrolase [Parasphingorhabdus cellanae]